MKITIINGSMRKGSTWHSMDFIRQELLKNGDTEITEFSLPKDLPQFCHGCFTCFYKGEQNCPHAKFVQPIAHAVLDCDLLILTSPVYGLDVSGAMKALIDHLCYLWMPHRPDPRMFQKIGLTVSTTGGAGLGHTSRTMRKSMTYWGMKKIFTFNNMVGASNWNEVSAKKQAKIEKSAKDLAKKIAKAVRKAPKLRNPLFRSVLFTLMKRTQKGNNWNPTDRAHWEAQGWLGNVKPF